MPSSGLQEAQRGTEGGGKVATIIILIMDDATGRILSLPPKGLDLFIEQFDGRDCPNLRVPWMTAINTAAGQALIFRPRCKMWSCPICGRANAWVWAFRAQDGAKELYDSGKPIRFVTITPHERLSPGASWWVMPHAWMKLQARVRRATNGFEYLCVPELHKSNKVHLHMLTTAPLSKRWWKDNARACGFGYQNDAQEVWSVGGVIGYVEKYLMKGLTDSVPKGTRRVRTSRGWPKSETREPPPGWEFSLVDRNVNVEYLAEAYRLRGLRVAITGSKSSWDYVDKSRQSEPAT